MAGYGLRCQRKVGRSVPAIPGGCNWEHHRQRIIQRYFCSSDCNFSFERWYNLHVRLCLSTGERYGLCDLRCLQRNFDQHFEQ